jgi:hypothetical protein
MLNAGAGGAGPAAIVAAPRDSRIAVEDSGLK